MKFFMKMSLIFIAVILATCQSQKQEKRDPVLNNFIELSPQILSGGEPRGEKAFQALSQKGVQAILSVDGAKPQVDLARKYGMQYFHIPLGYNRWELDEVAKVIKAFMSARYPLYVHCHHGQHRGPTAAAIGRIFIERVSRAQAIREMKQAGTSLRYQGLYKTIKNFRFPSRSHLDQLPPIPSVASVGGFQAAMAQIDRHWGELEKSEKFKWADDPDHPDIHIPHEALQLAELLTELSRKEKQGNRPQKFKEELVGSQVAAWEFERLVRDFRKKKTNNLEDVNQSFKRLERTCFQCHRTFRD